ncbi:MAG TPA: cupredoxin domain-containing protein [Actinomycetota bacterium]|nr:cupredoxin domain-containing protein [Actinomycetota bacterium]
MPGIPRLTRALNVAVALAAAALVGSACAPQSEPPNVPLSSGSSAFQTQVVDQIYDVGRSPSVTVDSSGNPSVAYLLLQPVLTQGALPPPLLANTPQPPSVVIAFQHDSIWTRRNVTPNATGGGKGTATEIADKKGFYDGVSTVAMAVDSKGIHRVAWSTPSGVFYNEDAPVTLPDKSTTLVFGDKVDQVTSKAASGVSIAVDSSDHAWIAFYQGPNVELAHQTGSGWSVDRVARANECTTCPSVRTAVVAPSPGHAIVAYESGASSLDVAQKTSTSVSSTSSSWTTSTVTSQGGFGVSMTMPTGASLSLHAGSPVLAYYDASGDIETATASPGGSWATARVGTGGSEPTASDELTAWATGIGAADGNLWISWANLSVGRIMIAEGKVGSGSFTADVIPQSSAGWSPSLAISSNAKHVAIAWYDSFNHRMNVATNASGQLRLAVPSPVFSAVPTPVPSGAPPCLPSGSSTTLSIDAPTGASATGFSSNCLAVVPGVSFKVTFTNSDTTAHNFAIFTNSSATDQLGGATSSEVVVPGASSTYTVNALKPGTYFFRCDLHPSTMTGTFVVAPPGKGGGASTPTPTPSA